MSIYDKSSLVLIPSGTKTGKVFSQKPVSGDGDFTFTRASAATRVNADGNIEKETGNLLLQSNTFDTSPFVTSNVSLTSGQSGYDGTNDAWELSTTGVNGFENLYQNISFTGVHTISIYAKAGSNAYLTIRSLTSDFRVQFKLDDGTHSATFGSPINTFMEDAGAGWYRCGFTANFSSASSWVFYPQRIGITDAGNILIQDAQLEQGLVARDYIETTTAAVYGGITDNTPRLDYTDSSCPALLLEPQRTNLVTQSEYFGASNWTALRSSIALSSVTSPEGVANAYKLTTDSTANNTHIIYYGGTLTSGIYSLSLYAKAAEFSKIGMGTGNLTLSAKFDLSSGSVITSGAHTASIESAGNDWYRCTIVTTTTTPIRIVLLDNDGNISFDGDGTSGLYIFGNQAEAGSYATSYIPTYGSSVTRNQDAPNMQTSSLVPNGFFSDTYSIMFDYKDFDRGAGSANLNYLYDTSNQVCMYIYGGTISIHTPSGEQYISFPEADGKLAFIYDGTNLKIYKNGSQYNSTIAVSTRWGNPSFYRLYALNTTSTISYNTFMLFPTALTDQEAIDLTTI